MKKPPFWATFFTIIGVLILCGLGAWQLERLAWKTDILEKLEKAYQTQSPVPFDLKMLKAQELPIGAVTGTLLPSKSVLIGIEQRKGKDGQDIFGKHLLTPMKTQDGILWIQLGWTDKDLDNQALYTRDEMPDITINGIIRKPSWNSFTPQNNLETDTWYRRDTNQLSEAKQLNETTYPFILYAYGEPSETLNNQYPNNKKWAPNNNHKQYAFFWFAMAAAMLIIFGLRFLRKQN